MNRCPECDAEVTVPQDAMQGEILPCGDCGIELEVVEREPLTLGAAPAVEEDWGE